MAVAATVALVTVPVTRTVSPTARADTELGRMTVTLVADDVVTVVVAPPVSVTRRVPEPTEETVPVRVVPPPRGPAGPGAAVVLAPLSVMRVAAIPPLALLPPMTT
jgi:hypothetical protein